MRLPKFLASRIIPPADSTGPLLPAATHHVHDDHDLISPQDSSPSLDSGLIAPAAASALQDSSFRSTPASSAELYRASESLHHHALHHISTSQGNNPPLASPLRQNTHQQPPILSANLSNTTSTTLANSTDEDYYYPDDEEEEDDDDDDDDISNSSTSSGTLASSSPPSKKKPSNPSSSRSNKHPKHVAGPLAHPSGTNTPISNPSRPSPYDFPLLSEKAAFASYALPLPDHHHNQNQNAWWSNAATTANIPPILRASLARARAWASNTATLLSSPALMRARIRSAAVSTSRTASYLARARFMIKTNITVPLWLVALVALLLSIFSLLSLLTAIFGSAAAVLPAAVSSVGGLRPPSIREINGKIDAPFVLGCTEPAVNEPRANAVLVVLARNKEYPGVIDSMRSLERHFNRWFHYPYVFLNDEPFNSTFMQAVKNVTDSEVKFGVIDKEVWNFPGWAPEDDVKEAIQQQGDRAIMYGGMASYHRMCRFYSGAFFNHPLLADYEWYWRVEPDVKYFCDITYDPFKYMEKHKKVYGFTIVIKELVETVPNLFRHTYGFKKQHNITSKGMWELFLKKHGPETADEALGNSGTVQKNKERERLNRIKEEKQRLQRLQDSLPDEALLGDPAANNVLLAGQELLHEDDNTQRLDVANYDYFAHTVPPYSINGETYNMCHFWSNFEIARLDFFRSKEYKAYFDALDKSGGFWTERWGDAPVHSLAAGLFLSPSQVHYFRDIGYRHTTIQHCPANAPERQLPHRPYIRDPTDRKEIEEDDYWANSDPEVMNGVGCRCRCDTDVVEVEGKDGSCLGEWVDLMGGWV